MHAANTPSSGPSTEEILELTEGKDLFRSNLFRLQLTELLNEVRVPQSKTKSTQTELHQLKEVLESLPDHEITSTYIQKLSPTLHNPNTHPKLEFLFQAPSQLQVIGSFLLNTICKPCMNVDLALEIPKVCGSSIVLKIGRLIDGYLAMFDWFRCW